MDGETFRSRVINLVARSRKALRLYSNVGKFQSDAVSEITERQTREWKHVTADLLKELTSKLEETKTSRELVDAVYGLRDQFNIQWRSVEADLHPKQKELISAAESGDFVRASILSAELVLFKARMQAAHAAHHELEDVLKRSRVSKSTIILSNDMLSNDDALEDNGEPFVGELLASNAQPAAKVIPIRKIL